MKLKEINGTTINIDMITTYNPVSKYIHLADGTSIGNVDPEAFAELIKDKKTKTVK